MLARKITPSLAVVIALGTACSDGTGPSSQNPGSVTLRIVAAPSSQSTTSAATAAPDSVRVGSHLLILDKVEILLRKIRLERANPSESCADVDRRNGDDRAPSASGDDQSGRDEKDGDNNQTGKDEKDGDNNQNGDDQGHHGDDAHADCQVVAIGPVLVDLPLGGTPEKLVSVDVDAGTYQRVQFRLHKAGDDQDDAAFLTANPSWRGISVKVQGKFDGKAFVYVNDVTAVQVANLVPPLVVGQSASTSLTLVVEAASWFVRGGVGLIDPLTALVGKPNEGVVRDNIRRSFRLFEDENADGNDDHR